MLDICTAQEIMCILSKLNYSKANIKPYNEECSESLKSFHKSIFIEKLGFLAKSFQSQWKYVSK